MSEKREFVPISSAQPPFFAGVDLGGTNVKAGLVDNAGRPIAYLSVPTRVEEGPEEGARRMGKAVHDVIGEADVPPEKVVRVGLGTPGTMDIPAGLLLEPHNLPGWFQFPIRDRVSHHADLPVTFVNDANAAAFGEFWSGRSRDDHSMIFLTLGTGVGGGIIIGELNIEGEHGAGSECGHIVIDSSPDARLCPCGRRGHLEGYASATAVIARTNEALDEARSGATDGGALARAREGGETITPLVVAREAEAGDALARHVVMETARYLGIGITSLVHTIDPDRVVLGGAMTFGGDGSPLGRAFLERVIDEVRQRALGPVGEALQIDFALLGGDAGYIGAAGLARMDYQRL